jgi:hypothetical protein
MVILLFLEICRGEICIPASAEGCQQAISALDAVGKPSAIVKRKCRIVCSTLILESKSDLLNLPGLSETWLCVHVNTPQLVWHSIPHKGLAVELSSELCYKE